jgi:hypothetical protein
VESQPVGIALQRTRKVNLIGGICVWRVCRLKPWKEGRKMTELNQVRSEANRDAGIAHAVGGAEIKEPGWIEAALKYLERYPYNKFMTEELRLWSHANGLPHPSNNRVWGGVVRVAHNRGLITHKGYNNVRNPKAHSTPASVWEKS